MENPYIITKEISDEEVIKRYTEALYGKNQSMMTAGICAANMHERGYEIIETENDPHKFIKELIEPIEPIEPIAKKKAKTPKKKSKAKPKAA